MSKYSKRYSQSSILKARKLRQETTEAERKLWSLLRGNKMGAHFRRQVPIGPYIVDFVSSQSKIVVELDGSQHFLKKEILRDTKRTMYLQNQGYEVLRFNNLEFLKNPAVVVETIFNHIHN